MKLEDIMSAHHSVTSGSEFWQRIMQEMYNTSMQQLLVEQKNAWTTMRDERPRVTLKKNWMPTMTWKDDALILSAVSERELFNRLQTKTTTSFSLDLGVAEKFGFVEQKPGVLGYVLGPNLQFTLPSVTFDSSTKPTDIRNRTDYFWEGEQFSGLQPTDVIRGVTDRVYLVKNQRLHLSRMVEWQFNNLNASFEKMVGTRKRTVMVYSDLVESTVVGTGKFPLLREVQLLRTGEGESTAEPLHHQWIKVRGNQLEILEVEIASTGGPLAILPPGKTLVTIGLKRL